MVASSSLFYTTSLSILLPSLALWTGSLQADDVGILGGIDFTLRPFAVIVQPSGNATPITGFSSLPQGQIQTVAISPFGNGLVGGLTGAPINPYAASIALPGSATAISGETPVGGGRIFSVALNVNGIGIMGGQDNGESYPYAAIVSPLGIATKVTGLDPIGSGAITTVAINGSGTGIIGGKDSNQLPYAAIVSGGAATKISSLPVTQGNIMSVAINSGGNAIIGGEQGNFAVPYAAIVSAGGATAVTGGGAPTGTGKIRSVAINDSSAAIIGGTDTDGQTPYAATVTSGGLATKITGDVPIAPGDINSVAIAPSGAGIIGGDEDGNFPNSLPYAAVVTSSGVATKITGELPSGKGTILSVAIAPSGTGIIAGFENGTNFPYAAFVSPTGVATRITGAVPIPLVVTLAAAIADLKIPVISLSGNVATIANYINQNSPNLTPFFIPSIFDGTLSQALASTAPTTNGFSTYTASYNTFYLSAGVSTHLRNQRSVQSRTAARNAPVALASERSRAPDQLLASLSIPKGKKEPKTCVPGAPTQDKRPYTVWFEGIGALSYQKAQSQTPAFSPASAGAIVAFDGRTSENSRVGVGATYLYTHLHQKKHGGHSDINQEDLFVYATWEKRSSYLGKKSFYIDGSLLGGLYQVDQVRNISITGFAFQATSHPHGWQLVPHLELGYNFSLVNCRQSVELRFNPFIMADWANAWQDSFKEKGAGSFNTGQKGAYSSLLRMEAGLRFYQTILFSHWNLMFQETGAYVNLHSFDAGRVHGFFVGSPGSFTVETLSASQSLGLAQFVMVFAPYDSHLPETSLFYQGEFGVKSQSHQVGLEFAWNF